MYMQIAINGWYLTVHTKDKVGKAAWCNSKEFHLTSGCYILCNTLMFTWGYYI